MSAQSMSALAKAQERRLDRAKLRREVAAMLPEAGRCRLAELIEAPPESMLTLPIGEALQWVRLVGRTNARRALREMQMSEGVAVGFLTPRQRGVVVAWLRGWS